jgi:hypothetical protein
MWLAFCFPEDGAALWAIAGLRRRGLVPLQAISPYALILSRNLVHEIRGGQSRTTFTLPDGSTIDSDRVQGVLNRVTALPLEHLEGASGTDAVYASQELHALVLSILHGLGRRVINHPSPQGLAGYVRPHAEWVALAGRAGFQTAAYREGNIAHTEDDSLPHGIRRHAIVLDERVHGLAPPSQVSASCVELRRLAGARLLGIDLVEASSGTWWFRAASPVPDLRLGGETLLDALSVILGGEAT